MAIERVFNAKKREGGYIGWVLRFFVFIATFWIIAWGVMRAETFHEIKQGETVFSIARQYGISPQEILKQNPKLRPKQIRVGQKIKIPECKKNPALEEKVAPAAPISPPAIEETKKEVHVVQKGETLTKIARRYDISLVKLKELNSLKSDSIRVGQILTVRNVATSLNDPESKTVDESLASAQKIFSSPPPPSSSPLPKYIFVSKVKAQIDAPQHFRPWKFIVVHHSGTPNGNARIFDYYHSHIRHMENGMAYHFVIGNGTDSGDGQIEVGQRWTKQLQGGHVSGDELNEVAIGICLVGNFDKERPTKKQIASLVELINYLNSKLPEKTKFEVHREANPQHTNCPGRFFPTKALHKLFG